MEGNPSWKMFLDKKNAHDLAKQLSAAICSDEKNRKCTSYLQFISSICKHHTHPQCLSSRNMNDYLAALPIAEDAKICDDEWCLQVVGKRKEINDFYQLKVARMQKQKQRVDLVNNHVTRRFPTAFDFMPMYTFSEKPSWFAFNLIDENRARSECNSLDERSEMAELGLAIINLKLVNQRTILVRIKEQLAKASCLQSSEKQFLYRLVIDGDVFDFRRNDLLDEFPIVLEEPALKFAIDILQGRGEESVHRAKIMTIIGDNTRISHRFKDIVYELFALSEYNNYLLATLMSISDVEAKD